MESLFAGSISVTFILLAVNVAVSLFGFWALPRKRHRARVLFIPSKAAKGENWSGTLLSHFAHGDVGHLIVNMIALYFFGPRVERALGPGLYLLLYVLSGATATTAIFILRRKKRGHAALGASGSIAGVLFATVVLAPTSSIVLLFIPIPIPAPVFALLYLVISSFMMGSRDQVSHEAHIGGAIAGFVLAGLFADQGFAPLIRAVGRLLS